MPESIASLERQIVSCRKCPRLVRYLNATKKKFPACWSKPVPAFGDPKAGILLIGLAPGRLGSNRTGRMFTGDASGDFLFPVLYKVGLSSKPKAISRRDGLRLKNAFITATIRCAPPQNKPTPREIANCFPYLENELALLSNVRVVMALGKIAHDEYVRFRLRQGNQKMGDFPFGHGNIHYFETRPEILIDSYHPSRQNTNTGKLTESMFLDVFRRAVHFGRERFKARLKPDR